MLPTLGRSLLEKGHEPTLNRKQKKPQASDTTAPNTEKELPKLSSGAGKTEKNASALARMVKNFL